MVQPAEADQNCPQCGSRGTYVYPTNDVFVCGTCGIQEPHEDVRGPPPAL